MCISEVSFDLYTTEVDKKLSLSLLPIESSSQSEEGQDKQHMSPQLLTKAFAVKSTCFIC